MAQASLWYTLLFAMIHSDTQVRSLARVGNGECEMLDGTDGMTEKVMRQLHRAIQPAFCDVNIRWNALGSRKNVLQCPRMIPALFTGSRHFVYGLELGSLAELPDQADLLVQARTNSRSSSDVLTIRVSLDKKSVTCMCMLC